MPDSTSPIAEDAELRAHVEQTLSNTYEVDKELGRGGMGIVYRAKDRRLKRTVAIKLLPPELSFRRDIRSRFLREAETAAQLSHPNIVPIYSVDEVGNLVFFVMACIEGDNLARQVQKRGPLPIAEVRRWLTEVADALAYAHHRGVIHRDIKPDNILVDAVDGRALVTDFGIARAAYDSGDASRLTATGMAIGTPTYMSPEQASGDRDVDHRTDLYALGVVAYQMITGEPPFIGNSTPALLIKHLTEMPVDPRQRRADVPDDMAMIVMRLLEKNPDGRLQSAAELAQALRSGVVPSAPSGAVRFDGSAIGGMPMPPKAPPAPLYGDARNVGMQPMAPWGNSPGQSSTGIDLVFQTNASRHYTPTPEEIARWNEPMVVEFRKKFATYLFVNGAIVVVSVFTDRGILGVSTMWTVYIAFKYAKLWSNNYDWKDVLRQPQDRMFGEVLSDVADSFLSVFSSKKRQELRARGHRPDTLRGMLSPNSPTSPPGSIASSSSGKGGAKAAAPMTSSASDDVLGAYAPLIHRAREDREEIARLLNTLPPSERGRIPDVSGTAATLVSKLETIAIDLARTERELRLRPEHEIEAEISRLESEANPLDTNGSEARVRRLAMLRRERRATIDQLQKLEKRRGQLESCRLALENVRLDLVRLRTGNSSVQSVTLIAEQAMALAHDVDIAVAAAQEVRRATRVASGA